MGYQVLQVKDDLGDVHDLGTTATESGGAAVTTYVDGGTVEIKNDTGNPIPVSVTTGTVSVTNINALAVTAALSVTNYNLATSSYSGTIAASNDYLLSTIKIGFSTASPRDIVVRAGARVLFSESGNVDTDLLLDFEGIPFDATETVTVTVSQTPGACLITSLIANIEQGSAALGGQPILGAGTNHIGSVSVDTAGSTAGDAFGRLRTSSPFTLFDTVHSYDLSPLYWDKIEATGGTVTSTTLLSGATLATTTASGSRAVFQTHNYLRYQPGKSQMILATGVLGANTTNVLRRVGYFDDSDGLFFEVNGTDICIVRRTSTSGTPVDNKVNQSAWNQDKMDGTGPSGLTLDTTKMQIYVIDFQWLSIGQVRYGVEINGAIIYVHISYHANILSVPYMRTANLPVRYEIVNTGTTSSTNSMLAVCSTVLTEGGQEVFGTPFAADSGTTPVAVSIAGVPVPVFSIRPKLTFSGITNRGVIELVQANTSNVQQIVLYQIWRNPTLTGASWTSADANSITEVDTVATAMSGGQKLTSFYSGGNTGAAHAETINLGKLRLSLNALGTVGDIYTLSAAKVASNDGGIFGALSWLEHR